MPVVPCPTPRPQPVHGVVEFDATEFNTLYPEFAGLASGVEQNAFNDAVFFLNNSCCSAVRDANQRLILLYKLTAHVLFLTQGTNDGAGNVTTPQGIVGRIDSATEGSVSVSAQYNAVISESEAYFIQSQYGAAFWQMTAQYRTALYIPPPAFGPNGPGYDAFFGFGGDF
jgi:Protein of unknown function (DUF4054)